MIVNEPQTRGRVEDVLPSLNAEFGKIKTLPSG